MDPLEGMTIPLALILLAAALFYLVLTVLWIALPFAVFGIKKRLDRMLIVLEEIRDRPLPGPRPGDDIQIPDSAKDIFSSSRRS